MSILSTIRTYLSTRQEHLDDHMVLASFNNEHPIDTTDVHGIIDTAALETIAGATAKVTAHAASGTDHSGVYALLTETVAVVAASGTAQTIPEPSTATISRITLTGNCTFTFPVAAAGKSFTVVLIQDGTGSRLATWPAAVKWSSAAVPTLSTGINKVDYLSFVCTDGTTWAGFIGGLDIR